VQIDRGRLERWRPEITRLGCAPALSHGCANAWMRFEAHSVFGLTDTDAELIGYGIDVGQPAQVRLKDALALQAA
jgi:hypothetical protein